MHPPRWLVPVLVMTIACGGAPREPSKLSNATNSHTTGKPVALAVVVAGQEIWIGNDDFETDEAAKYPGVLHKLAAALDSAKLAESLPPGSQGTVITYSIGAQILVPWGAIERITGRALGTQKDYFGKIGTDLVQGVTVGLAELGKASAPRKVLLVIGDGNDTNNEAATSRLAELKTQAAASNIETYAIIYKSAVSSDDNVITKLVPNATTLTSADGFGAQLEAIIQRLH